MSAQPMVEAKEAEQPEVRIVSSGSESMLGIASCGYDSARDPVARGHEPLVAAALRPNVPISALCAMLG